MPPRSKKQQEQEPPATAIPRVFDQVQGSTANHQKNFVALHKVHAQAARQVEPINNGRNVKLVGERAFEDAVLDSLTRVLPVKKGVTVADRVVKFVGGYVKFANEKASAKRAFLRALFWGLHLIVSGSGGRGGGRGRGDDCRALREPTAQVPPARLRGQGQGRPLSMRWTRGGDGVLPR
jgi:hypothetical protein